MILARALALAALFVWAAAAPASADSALSAAARRSVEFFAALPDRTTGGEGAALAADHIARTFESLGFVTDRHVFLTPRRVHGPARLVLADGKGELPLLPFETNALAPQGLPPGGIAAPLIWTGRGTLAEMEGRPVAGAIAVMELLSGKNWTNAANLGAAAVIFVDRGTPVRGYFTDKRELTPINLPTFLVGAAQLERVLPGFDRLEGPAARGEFSARLTGSARWEQAAAENIYCLVPGADPRRTDDLLVVEAFFDTEALTPGASPGAEAASSVTALLELARRFKETPPARSVLLLATSGNAQGLAGVRDFVWSVRAKAKRLMDMEREQRSRANAAKAALRILESCAAGRPLAQLTEPEADLVAKTLRTQIKNRIDSLSTRLMQLRMADNAGHEAEIRELARHRMHLRNMAEDTELSRLAPHDLAVMEEFIPAAMVEQRAVAADAEEQYRAVKSARRARAVIAQREVSAWVSLHLSTHGTGVGAFNHGFHYDIRPDRNRNPAYGPLERILTAAAERIPAQTGAAPFRDTLRPSRIRPWESWFLDRPGLGGEVAALGGMLGLTLATVEDARATWGTRYDTPDRVDYASLAAQITLVAELVRELATVPQPLYRDLPRQGLSELEGRARFIRQGELFPDQPAPGTVVQVYQGPAMVYAMVDTEGVFRLTGLSDSKNTFHKAIIEAYRFDAEDGRPIWAVDKKQTGKDAYRVKMVRMGMETDLVMFAARPINLAGLLEPRTFNYMTRIDLYDGRRDATPLKYWFSRMDTRESTQAAIFLEGGTPLKMTLSDTVLTRKLILTHAVEDDPEGEGYMPRSFPRITATEFRVAEDMWALLGPRVQNLETHGIVNDRIRDLQGRGTAALAAAREAHAEQRWGDFLENSRSSWALALRVYRDVESTQRDVLLGVLFYIALFVPFAYCAERVLFAFADIHKRILGFLGILCAVIAVIYMVHPAFQLTYSPLVVILAFFIAGLSALVSVIIFMRFEREMERLQRRAGHVTASEVSRLRAFGAAFVIGVTNLRRRKVRTTLTVVTLIILTFTIMSFTSVKSVRQSSASQFRDTASYQGVLMKSLGWASLPREAEDMVREAVRGEAVAAPRVWLEQDDRTTAPYVPVARGERHDEARALVGMSADEPRVSGLDGVLVGGRWLLHGESRAAILPVDLAQRLGIDPAAPGGAEILLWGLPFSVVGCFDPVRMDGFTDLDGEPPTPVIFPSETVAALAESQADDLESGEDISVFQSRYQHMQSGQMIIVQAQTALALGGRLKSLALAPDSGDSKALARSMADRFGLPLFVGGPSGTSLYSATDSIDYSGVPNIAVPLIIAVCIVLNTMISSVYERKREIGVYTSIGMAPTHVSYLFIAEAVAFAVLSAVLGYLLAQTAAGLLSGTSLWEGMTANYSSLSGVAAMFLVITVTLLSVIYPAKVAADIAIPDVSRSWVMPDASGNEVTLTLPFLLKAPEQECVGGFLLDYYQSHRDVTHGLFCSDDISCEFACPIQGFGDKPGVGPDGVPDCLNLRASIWLAPFDFGVKQYTELTFCPSSDQPGFLEIRIRIVREAGEASIWRRLNKNFLNDLRKQLLVWRSLDEEGRADYENRLRHFMGPRQDSQG